MTVLGPMFGEPGLTEREVKMGSVIKGIVYLLVGVVVVVGGLFAAVAVLVDPNDYKGEIQQLVKEQTGRELQIKQEISLTFFPWIGIALGGVELSNAKGFGQEPFLGVDSVNVRVKLMPLFAKKLEADSITVKGLSLNLAKNAAGVSNWDDLAPAEQKDAAPGKAAADTADSPDGSASGPAVSALAVSGVEIVDAALRWHDAAAGVDYTIKEINLRTGKLVVGEPFSVNLGFALSSKEPQMVARLEFSGRAALDFAAQIYSFSAGKLQVAAEGAGVPGKAAELKMGFAAIADLGRETLEVSGLELVAMGVTATGKISGTAIVAKPNFKADLSIAQFSLKELLAKLSDQAIITADSAAMEKLSVDIAVVAGLNQARLTKLQLRLDDSLLQGSAAVVNFDKPAINFDLELDKIDVDRYLPPKTAADKDGGSDGAGKGKNTTTTAKGEPPPLKPLRDLILDGKFKAGELKVANARLQDLKVGINAKGGVIKVAPLAANLYQGSFFGSADMDVRSNSPAIAVDYKLEKIQAGPLLQDVSGVDRLSGMARSSAKITARGLQPEQIKKTLNGQADFVFDHGAIKGINIARLIRNAYNVLKGQPPEPEGTAEKTDFTELSGSVNIKNGLVNNQDLSMQSPLLRITGKGEVDLPENTINYMARTAIVGTVEGQGGRQIAELKNVVIPVKISGSLDDPKVSPDVAAILQENIKSQAKEKLKEQIGEKLKSQGLGGAGGLLKNVLPF